jgi:hypothetical protein
MSSDRKRILRDYPTYSPGMRVHVEVYYSKGERDSRGYWLQVFPCEIRDGMMIVTLGSGSRRFIAAASRFSKKGMADAAWLAEGWLLKDDPVVRQQIAACGEVMA